MGKNEKGERFANIHLLEGYNQGTIKNFQDMAAKMRETFPAATDDQVKCGHVTESHVHKHFSIIALDAHIPEGDYPGWHQNKTGTCEYSWC